MLAKVDEKEEKQATLDLSVCRSGKGPMFSLLSETRMLREKTISSEILHTHTDLYMYLARNEEKS